MDYVLHGREVWTWLQRCNSHDSTKTFVKIHFCSACESNKIVHDYVLQTIHISLKYSFVFKPLFKTICHGRKG